MHGHLRGNLYQLMDHHEKDYVIQLRNISKHFRFGVCHSNFFPKIIFSAVRLEKIIFKIAVQDDSSNVITSGRTSGT